MFLRKIFGSIRRRADGWLPRLMLIFGVCRFGAWALETWTGQECGVGKNSLIEGA